VEKNGDEVVQGGKRRIDVVTTKEKLKVQKMIFVMR
jgi:hypothetical protein